MKSLGKIVVMFVSLFVLSAIFWFINLENGGEGIGGLGLIITISFSWFISFSKWANDNIWNSNKLNNTSFNSSSEAVEANYENQEVSNDLKSNPEDNSNDVKQKIKELKSQIKNLEESLNDNDSLTESNNLSVKEIYEEIKNKKNQ
jgi:hypothetical protein